MAINPNQTIDHITDHFLFDGHPISCIPFGNGHINNTFVVTTSTNKKYILQEINTNIFTDPNLLMSNMVMVTKQLKKVNKQGDTLEVIPTKTGGSYFLDATQKAWRVLNYFDDHCVFDKAPNPELAYEGAKMFGKFTNDLSVIAPEKIKAVIPNFHHMTSRLNQLETASKRTQKMVPYAQPYARDTDFQGFRSMKRLQNELKKDPPYSSNPMRGAPFSQDLDRGDGFEKDTSRKNSHMRN